MKKIFLFLLVVIVSFPLFSTGLLYSQDSDLVQELYGLFRKGNAVLPSFIFPVSADTLLEVIEYTALEDALYGESLDSLYAIERELSGENVLYRASRDFAFNADAEASVLVYTQSADEKDIFKEKYSYQPGYEVPFRNNQIPSFLKGGADLFMTRYATGHFEYEYSTNFEEYTLNKTQSNIPIGRNRLDSVPFNVYLNVGTKHISAFAGKVRSSSGAGITGNLGIGDNFLFRNTIKFQINALPFVYELLVNRFDAEVLDPAVNKESHDTKSSNLTHISRLDEKVPVLVVHKVNFLISKRFNIGLYEALLDYSKVTVADPKLLGPFNIFHNSLSYQYDSNNFFGFDIDFIPARGLAFHTEVIFDQIQLSDEKNKKVPGAFGVLLNARYSFNKGDSDFTLYAEGVYTNPWLYLKPSGDYSSTDDNYFTLDLITGNYHNRDAKIDTGYVGYKYGPNTVVADIGLIWKKKNNTFTADLLYKTNGNTGIYYNDKTARGKDEYVNATSPYIYDNPSGAAQRLLQITVADTLTLFEKKSVKIGGGITYQRYNNYNCEKGRELNNFIFSIGVIVHPLKMIIKK